MERLKAWLYRDVYSLLGYLTFCVIVVFEWRNYVRKHEAIYLLGSRRVFEPEFLAGDLSWSTLPPTTFAWDYLLAPLWGIWDDFGIVTIGRLVVWLLFAWGLAQLARALRLPIWAVLGGLLLWLLWGQRISNCGSPLEGLQPKSFAYPLIFYSLAAVMQGNMLRAGAAAGVATVFHIIIGGWSTAAIFGALCLNRRHFPLRDLGLFLTGTAPFIVPFVLFVGLFHTAGTSAGEQFTMDQIYVRFAQPHCIDPDFFMNTEVWLRALTIFPLSLALVLIWPQRREGRVLAGYLAGLVALFGLGLLAGQLEWYTLLKLYPFQLANALPALFLVIFTLALAAGYRHLHRASQGILACGVLLCLWMVVDEDVLTEELVSVSTDFVTAFDIDEPIRYGNKVSSNRRAMYAWIRGNTSRDGLFVTPYLPEFWTYAERDQLAGFRHPPHDRRILEWYERLQALNGFQAFKRRGFAIRKELGDNQSQLTIQDLAEIGSRYGATHYLTKRRRPELDAELLFSVGRYHLYDLARLTSAED